MDNNQVVIAIFLSLCTLVVLWWACGVAGRTIDRANTNTARVTAAPSTASV